MFLLLKEPHILTKVLIIFSDVFCGLSPDEKRGQKTPLCKTPVSDMLQFAAQLLPVSPCPLTPPAGHTFNHGHRATAEYSSLYQSHCLYNVPPVPRNAPHVSTLEQQQEEEDHHHNNDDDDDDDAHGAFRNYKKSTPNNESSSQDQSCDVVHKLTEPGLITDKTGTLCIQSSDSINDDDDDVHHIKFRTIGGTLFWSKNEGNTDPITNSAHTPGMTSSSFAEVSPPTCSHQYVRDTSSPKLMGNQDMAADDKLDRRYLGSSSLPVIKESANKSAISESFSSPSGSPTYSVAERLCQIGITSSSPTLPNTSREHDDQQQAQEAHPLMDSGIASPGSLSKNHGSGAEEDLDGSTASTPSPSRKLGTPRRSRLAAKFTASDTNSS